MIEREYRYQVDYSVLSEIRRKTKIVNGVHSVIDLVLGWYGFESIKLQGFICRIRKSGDEVSLECKSRKDEFTWQEAHLPCIGTKKALDFLQCMGMQPYLVIKRVRETRTLNGVIVNIDNVDLLGDFVEIEIVNSTDIDDSSIAILEKMTQSMGIRSRQLPAYGDLMKELIGNDRQLHEAHATLLAEITFKFKENDL